ncbi:MAG: electron transfer flavoprotein subunit beta/FixA family protein [Pseudomonadota bacterium]
MDIVVAVKQVPEITDVKVNPETGTLIREGAPSILNPFCEYALDHAVRLKAKFPDIRITAVSMGPPQAREVLLRALELGADRAVLASDRKFAGADTWATALTLAETIRRTTPDFKLILVGKQAIDGDTAQVGPEMAEILSLPQISYGVGVELLQGGKKVRVKRELESGWQAVEARLPALASFSKGELTRRAPSFAAILAARAKPLEVVTAADLGLAEADLGLAGSFTQVVEIFPPRVKQTGRLLKNLESDEAVREIISLLQEKGALGRG